MSAECSAVLNWAKCSIPWQLLRLAPTGLPWTHWIQPYMQVCKYLHQVNIYYLVFRHWHEWISWGVCVSSSLSFMPKCHDLDPSPLFHREERHSKWAAWRILTPGNSINPCSCSILAFPWSPLCSLTGIFSGMFYFSALPKFLIQLEQLLSSNWKRCQSDLENTFQIPWNKANHRNGLLAFKLQNP